MIETLSEVPDPVIVFREAASSRQQATVFTPLDRLPELISVLFSIYPVASAWATTDEVVFEPRNMISFLDRHGIRLPDYWTLRLRATEEQDAKELLESVLAEWIDFCFVPSPEHFAIYADHDEYMTFYCQTQSELQMLRKSLTDAGFRFVDDYVRPSSGDRWK